MKKVMSVVEEMSWGVEEMREGETNSEVKSHHEYLSL